MSEQLESLAPYESVVTNMQNENYDAVIAEANEKKTEKMKEEAGDIEDYLVTVELTSENFEEYFEIVSAQHHNAFGENIKLCTWFIRSLSYDDLIIYDTGNIAFEYGGGVTGTSDLYQKGLC